MSYRFTVFVREESDFSSRVLYVTADSAAEAVTVAACECRAHGYALARTYYEVHNGVVPSCLGRAAHEEARPSVVDDHVATALEDELVALADRMEAGWC